MSILRTTFIVLALLAAISNAAFCKITSNLNQAPGSIQQTPIILTFVDGYQVTDTTTTANSILSAVAVGLAVGQARICVTDLTMNTGNNRWEAKVLFYPNFVNDANDATETQLREALLPTPGNPAPAVNTELNDKLDGSKCVYSDTGIILRLCATTSAFQEYSAICPGEADDPAMNNVDERGSLLSLILGIGSFVVTLIVVLIFRAAFTKYEEEADMKQAKRVEQLRKAAAESKPVEVKSAA